MTGVNYGETRGYNSRLQLTSLNGVTFNYSPNQNNGKIISQTESGETISYLYDSLNRLISASSSQGWVQSVRYDGFGNLIEKQSLGSPSVPTFSAGYDALTNRQVGISYDANGKQTTSPNGSYVPLSYDYENRLVSAPVDIGGVNTDVHGYDPDNRRVPRGAYLCV